PAILKPKQLYTGKQIYGILIRPNRKKEYNISVSFEMKEKMFKKPTNGPPHMDINDGYVCFRDSVHISGIMCKGTLGSGSKSGLFYQLMKLVGNKYAADCMRRLSKLSGRWITNRGFSFGIGDVTPSDDLIKKKEELVDIGYKNCVEIIAQLDSGKLEAAPGCTQEETMEALVNNALSSIRDKAGNMCLTELPNTNTPLIMAVSGSKGSNINISQMIACVGQQIVSGHRIPNGFAGQRTLPHFKIGSREPAAKGF
ncbi:MAG: putative DNA-directed RNA polymerase III subunit RPC1, partial [Streblomastix strix]